MKRVKSQLLKVLSILDEQAKLNPKDTAIQLHVELFSECPDYAPLLEKLADEYEVIEINQRSDEKGYSEADLEMFEMEQPKNYLRYISYFITLKPTFVAFYKTEYTKQRSTTSTLTENNKRLIVGMMQAIDDEVSITGATEVNVSPIADEVQCIKALNFLRKTGAIKDFKAIDEIDFNGEYERMMPTGQIDVFQVDVILPEFDEVFAELKNSEETVGKSPKRTIQTSSIEYDEEHAKATYRGKTKKLFDVGTIMSVLTYRVFRSDGARINAVDILTDIETERIDPDKEKTTKTLTNAKDRVNRRLDELFGTKDVIRYERQQFWLNQKYVSLESPYRTKTIKKKATAK